MKKENSIVMKKGSVVRSISFTSFLDDLGNLLKY